MSRLALEEELLAVRAMRHVFRVKPNRTLQAWVTLLNPIARNGYPLHWALMLEDGERLLEPTFPPKRFEAQPEFEHYLNGLPADAQGLRKGYAELAQVSRASLPPRTSE